MKEELSIEEKAKAYDEAIERAKSKIKNDKDHVLYEDDIIDIFPALKESEDERIRKALIRYFTLSNENAYNEACGVSYRDIVAWLKKQSTPQVRTGIEWVNTIDDACDKRYSEEYSHGEYCHEQSFKWGFQEGVDWLEEQGIERKQLYIRFGDIPSNEKSKIYRGEEEIGDENGVSVYPAFELNGNIVLGLTLPITRSTLYTQQHLLEYDNRPCYLVSGDYVGKGTDGEPLIRNISIIKRLDNYRIKEFKKQGEQKSIDDLTPQEAMDIAVAKCFEQGEKKSADKVEPKFKIEEEKWYVCTHTYVLKGKIVVIKGQTYQAEKDNVIKGENGCLFIDRHDGKALDYFRSWTIQDAKDGDVLLSPATPEGDKECPFIFKEIDKNGIVRYHVALLQNKDFKISNDVSNVMGYANAGYHVPATKEQRDLLFQKMKEAGYEWDAEKKELKKEKIDNLHNYLYGEQNPTWSKEDDYVFETLFCLLHNEQDKYPQQSSEFQKLEEIENKLKSFKYRLQPQSKWSEEDEKEMGRVIYMMEQLDLTESWSDCYTFLNSLKDRMQSKQEWKQENTGDLTDFENAMMHIGGSFFGDNAGLDPNDTNAIKEQANLLLELVPKQEWSEEDELQMQGIIDLLPGLTIRHNWLKSLKDRYTWKPSEEEMVALEHAINCYSGISPTNTNEVFILEIMKERLKNLKG